MISGSKRFEMAYVWSGLVYVSPVKNIFTTSSTRSLDSVLSFSFATVSSLSRSSFFARASSLSTKPNLAARAISVEITSSVSAMWSPLRWPFVIEGIALGAMGGVLAIGLLLVGKIALLDPLISQFSLLASPQTIQFGLLAAVLLGAAIAVSAAGSGLSLRRFLRV